MRGMLLMVALVAGCAGAKDDELPDCAVRAPTGCPLEGVTCDVCTAAETNPNGAKDVWAECSDGEHYGPGLPYDQVMDLVGYHCDPCAYVTGPDCADAG